MGIVTCLNLSIYLGVLWGNMLYDDLKHDQIKSSSGVREEYCCTNQGGIPSSSSSSVQWFNCGSCSQSQWLVFQEGNSKNGKPQWLWQELATILNTQPPLQATLGCTTPTMKFRMEVDPLRFTDWESNSRPPSQERGYAAQPWDKTRTNSGLKNMFGWLGMK